MTALVSFLKMARGLFHVVTCNDADFRAVMELTQDRVTDVVAGFRGENSNHRFETYLRTAPLFVR